MPVDNKGSINLHRQITEHWIWKDANKLKWWLDILLTVNRIEAKVTLGYEIFDCKRGQSLLSIQSWADRWHVSKDTARNFFTLLEKDKMILRVNIGKSTRITVCNYDGYNTRLPVKQTATDRNTDTNNNILSKDNINIRKADFKNGLYIFLEQYGKDMLNDFYKYWTELNQQKTKMRFELQKTWELNLRLANWGKNKNSDFKQQKPKPFNAWNGQDAQN